MAASGTSSDVAAPDVTGLIELSRDPQLDLKPVILRVQTDLFLAAPVRDRAALSAFASLAAGLIPTVDDDTALTVARKLAPFAETPRAVLESLAARGGAACRTVIETAPEIDASLVEAALASGTDIAPTIAVRAERERLQAEVVREAEQARLRALADDPQARLDRITLDDLLIQARRDAGLAAVLLTRCDLAAGDLAPLWLHADEAQRAGIREAVAATAALRPCPPPPRAIGPTLTGLSREGDVKGFCAALSESLGLPAAFLAAAPDPASRYDLLTLALRAADVSEAEAVYVFLTLNATVARSADRVFALVKLFRAVSRAAARDLLSAILDVPPPSRAPGSPSAGEHRPYYAPDGAKARSSIERTSVERPSARVGLPGRVRQSG